MKSKVLPVEWSVAEPETLPILVVDDDASFGAILGMCAESSLGARVTVCDSSEEALRAFAASPENWSLVITDFHMPGMNGRDLATLLRRIRPQVPVLILSAAASAASACAGLGQPLRFLTKPTASAGLREALQAIEQLRGRQSV